MYRLESTVTGEEIFLTKDQIKEIYGIGERQFYNWVKAGEVKPSRGTTLIRKAIKNMKGEWV